MPASRVYGFMTYEGRVRRRCTKRRAMSTPLKTCWGIPVLGDRTVLGRQRRKRPGSCGSFGKWTKKLDKFCRLRSAPCHKSNKIKCAPVAQADRATDF